MKNFHNCEPFTLQNDLKRLITQHKEREALRRIEAETRLQSLESELDAVTLHIALEGGKS
jgi:hypothetical protein